jgi:hypothetical protein
MQADLLARVAAEAQVSALGDSAHHVTALKQYLRGVNDAEAAGDIELLRVTLEQTAAYCVALVGRLSAASKAERPQVRGGGGRAAGAGGACLLLGSRLPAAAEAGAAGCCWGWGWYSSALKHVLPGVAGMCSHQTLMQTHPVQWWAVGPG